MATLLSDPFNLKVVYMKISVFFLVLFCFCFPVYAQTNEDGLSAVAAGDYDLAFEIWDELALSGDARAQSNLGALYDNGLGVEEDDFEAVRLFSLAARQGWGPAQFNLGLMYANGLGLDQNILMAYVWFELAAQNGVEQASKNVALIEPSMPSDIIEQAQDIIRTCLLSNYEKCG